MWYMLAYEGYPSDAHLMENILLHNLLNAADSSLSRKFFLSGILKVTA